MKIIWLLTSGCVTGRPAINFFKMADKILQIPNCLGPLKCLPCQQGDDKGYLGSFDGIEIKLHLQDKGTSQEESTAIILWARVGG